jgi:hypothetical protein
MRNKRYRPIFVIIFMAFLTAFKCISLMDKYPVRPILAVFLVALGGLIGVVLVSVGQMVKEKNKGENSENSNKVS